MVLGCSLKGEGEGFGSGLCICRIFSIWVCVFWVWGISGLGGQFAVGMVQSVGVAVGSFVC